MKFRKSGRIDGDWRGSSQVLQLELKLRERLRLSKMAERCQTHAPSQRNKVPAPK